MLHVKHNSAPHQNIINTPTGGYKMVSKIIQQSAAAIFFFV